MLKPSSVEPGWQWPRGSSPCWPHLGCLRQHRCLHLRWYFFSASDRNILTGPSWYIHIWLIQGKALTRWSWWVSQWFLLAVSPWPSWSRPLWAVPSRTQGSQQPSTAPSPTILESCTCLSEVRCTFDFFHFLTESMDALKMVHLGHNKLNHWLDRTSSP